jgi:hypothetical protein
LRELHKRGERVALFPIGNKADLSAYDLSEDFKKFLEDATHQRWVRWDSSEPVLKLWHLNGAENRKAEKQFLFTFYECNEPTDVELSIAKNQNHTFFSSNYAADAFKKNGVENVSAIPLGLDPDFKIKDVPKPDGIQFGLMGKFEYRKHTEKIVKTWLKKYGNNPKYTLNLCVNNPFFKAEEMQNIIRAVLDNKHYNNVNILPYFKTNQEVNDFLNINDIDLGGLSGAEGWNLPSFNATCLGKWSIVLNATSHKDWADMDNSILVRPKGIINAHDGVFFKKGEPFNQGYFFDWDEDDVINAMETAVNKVGTLNENGVKLGKSLTYENTVDKIYALLHLQK